MIGTCADDDIAAQAVPAAPDSSRGIILFIVNVDWFFLSHRLAIAIGAQRAGYAVHIACSTTGREGQLIAEGLQVHPLELARGESGILSALRSGWDMFRIIRAVKPDIVHLVTVKPVLLGGIAARMARVPKVVAAISGLGYLFIAQGPAARLRRFFVGVLYRLALGGRNVRVIFQNMDDRALISNLAGLNARQTRLIRGSGVDLERFQRRPLPTGPFVAVFAARLLVDKGIREFAEAARLVRSHGLNARFLVAGDRDPDNPACLSEAELTALKAEGDVELLGALKDMPDLFARAHVVVLPSYREGMPLVLLEAAAAGRAVITTDVPGCRSAIEADTGILVPVRNATALAEALLLLATDPARCEEMGRRGRTLAEKAFGIEGVVAAHLDLYGD